MIYFAWLNEVFFAMQGFLSIAMLAVQDVYTLINYMSFIEALTFTGSVSGLLILRWKKPDLPRPIKVK